MLKTAERREIRTEVISITKVEPRAGQPRTVFNDEALQDLAYSIEQHGILQPITVRPLDMGYFQIIAGERRWRAARLAGLTEIPVNIIDADDRKTQELALIENLQREDLNAIEEARGYRALATEYNLTQEAIAEAMGKTRPYIANSVRLLNLPPDVVSMVEEGTLSPGHAKTLLSLPKKEDQSSVACAVVERGLSVRQTEALVAAIQKKKHRKNKFQTSGPDYAAIMGEELGQLLGRKVSIEAGKKRGRIVLEFYDPDDREALLAALKTLRVSKYRTK